MLAGREQDRHAQPRQFVVAQYPRSQNVPRQPSNQRWWALRTSSSSVSALARLWLKKPPTSSATPWPIEMRREVSWSVIISRKGYYIRPLHFGRHAALWFAMAAALRNIFLRLGSQDGVVGQNWSAMPRLGRSQGMLSPNATFRPPARTVERTRPKALHRFWYARFPYASKNARALRLCCSHSRYLRSYGFSAAEDWRSCAGTDAERLPKHSRRLEGHRAASLAS